MRKRNVAIHSFTPHKGAFQDPFQSTYCSYCVTQGHICSNLNVHHSLFKRQPPLKKTALPFADPNSTHNSPIAIFPGLPATGPTLPLPSTQLKLPVCDLFFLSMELTALKGSSLLAADVQGSWAHQECSLYDARRGMCHINSGTRGGHQPVRTLLRCH